MNMEEDEEMRYDDDVYLFCFGYLVRFGFDNFELRV
jgi:hypothetical protein